MVSFDYVKTPITKIVDAIILESSKSGASDIHFDPREDGLVVRRRIDGDLVDYTKVPKVYERNLVTRLKLMAGMNITESRLPQDGAIKGKFGDRDLDMRVSSLPTNEGEKIVIRILDYSRSLNGIDQLGFNEENFVKLRNMIGVPNGIILITGATGSGKSTTSYSILQVLNKERTNIITVEDPIEMNIEGMNQVQVNSEIGMTFATALRSILRQDPNVILIGEIRDSETAKIAVRASITGHLVLSTLHTNNSLATIERLLDMDVERYLLSTALTGIISQRLAKTVCPHCKITRDATPYEKKVFKIALKKDIDKIIDANPKGCEHCNKGYRGRIAIQEVLEIDDDIRNALNNTSVDKEDLKRLVYGSGNVITLLQDGLRKILDGSTTFDEIYRIIEIDNDINDSYYQTFDEDISDEEKVKFDRELSRELDELKRIGTSVSSKVSANTTSVIKDAIKSTNDTSKDRNNAIISPINNTQPLPSSTIFSEKKENDSINLIPNNNSVTIEKNNSVIPSINNKQKTNNIIPDNNQINNTSIKPNIKDTSIIFPNLNTSTVVNTQDIKKQTPEVNSLPLQPIIPLQNNNKK